MKDSQECTSPIDIADMFSIPSKVTHILQLVHLKAEMYE